MGRYVIMNKIDTKFIGILNLTHNSFSDGGVHTKLNNAIAAYNDLIDHGATYVDIGAQSTVYNAVQMPTEMEWPILEPILRSIDKKNMLSVDTYNYATARRAIEIGVSIVNDVSGGRDPKMLDLIAANRSIKYIAMFSLTIPANKEVRIKDLSEIDDWFVATIKRFEKAGIDLSQVVLDPGIGFVTNSIQSFQVIKKINDYRKYGVQILIGHSRKSFLEHITQLSPAERDIETLAASMYMLGKVDYLRVHNVDIHARAKLVLDSLSKS